MHSRQPARVASRGAPAAPLVLPALLFAGRARLFGRSGCGRILFAARQFDARRFSTWHRRVAGIGGASRTGLVSISPRESPSAVMSSRERANPGATRFAGRRRNMPSKSTIAALSAFHGAPQVSDSRRNAGIMKEPTPLAQRNGADLRRRPHRQPARRYRLGPRASTSPPAGIKQVIDIISVYLRHRAAKRRPAMIPAASAGWSPPVPAWRAWRREQRAACTTGRLEQALHPAAVGFDPRHAGGHVHQQPVAAQHVLALGQDHPAEHGDEIGLGVEHRGLPGDDLILLGHHHIAFGFQPLDRGGSARTGGRRPGSARPWPARRPSH